MIQDNSSTSSNTSHCSSPSPESVVLLSKIRWWTKFQKKKTVSVNFSCTVFSLLDFLTLEDGTDRLSWIVGKDLPFYAA
jgi:hypothetical protein